MSDLIRRALDKWGRDLRDGPGFVGFAAWLCLILWADVMILAVIIMPLWLAGAIS